MCGRFALSKSDRLDWAQFGVRRGPTLPPHWNLGPGREIAVVRHAGKEREVAMLRWGLIPSWATDAAIGSKLTNARAETAHEKPAFRGAFRQRRCLIPADGFYEWQGVAGAKRKQPWFVRRADGGVFALAGLWERWQPVATAGEGAVPTVLESVTVLTCAPNTLMAPIHGRMPVIVAPEGYDAWLTATTTPADVQRLLAPWDPTGWESYRVGTRVNLTANDDAECAAPAPEELALG
jgi:putative SOS response-associated peptidase YedK